MNIKGTRGDDDLNGTPGDDAFNMAQGGDDTVAGGRGDDVFLYGKWLTAGDHIDGGDGGDTLAVNGDYTGANALVFGADTIAKIEAIQFHAGHSYDFTLADLTGVTDQMFALDAHALRAGGSVVLDASAVRFVHLNFSGGAFYNTFDLSHGGGDWAKGGFKDDVFIFGRTFDNADHVDGGSGAGVDTVQFKGAYGDAHAPWCWRPA